jgi:hypothetical protein
VKHLSPDSQAHRLTRTASLILLGLWFASYPQVSEFLSLHICMNNSLSMYINEIYLCNCSSLGNIMNPYFCDLSSHQLVTDGSQGGDVLSGIEFSRVFICLV